MRIVVAEFVTSFCWTSEGVVGTINDLHGEVKIRNITHTDLTQCIPLLVYFHAGF